MNPKLDQIYLIIILKWFNTNNIIFDKLYQINELYNIKKNKIDEGNDN